MRIRSDNGEEIQNYDIIVILTSLIKWHLYLAKMFLYPDILCFFWNCVWCVSMQWTAYFRSWRNQLSKKIIVHNALSKRFGTKNIKQKKAKLLALLCLAFNSPSLSGSRFNCVCAHFLSYWFWISDRPRKLVIYWDPVCRGVPGSTMSYTTVGGRLLVCWFCRNEFWGFLLRDIDVDGDVRVDVLDLILLRHCWRRDVSVFTRIDQTLRHFEKGGYSNSI